MSGRRALRSPITWAVACGLGLLLALSLPPWAPDWLFWAGAAISCVGATGWAAVVPRED